MKKIISLILISILYFQVTNAQMYKKHDWEKEPNFYKLSEDEKQLASFAIKEKTLIQYQTPVVGVSSHLYETKHNIIYVNSDKGIDRHNRVFISMYGVLRLVDIKARVLNDTGEIKVFNKSNIKELKNVKEYSNYKIFAIEGVEKNSQIEYIYTLERRISSVGSIVVQKDYKVKESEVIIKSPGMIMLDAKSYNGFPKLKKTTVKNRTAHQAIARDIPSMIEEKISASKANRMKVAYTFGRNNNASQQLWKSLQYGVSSRYMKANLSKHKSFLKKFDKVHQFAEDEDYAVKINKVCKYIHNNFNKVKKSGKQYEDLKYILTNKQVSSDRFNHKFDPYFYSNYNLGELLLFFPDIKKYVAPSQFRDYLSDAPINQLGNEGVFISKQGYNFYKIKVPNSDKTITDRRFKIDTNVEAENVEVSCVQKLTGYRAENARGGYRYYSKNDIKKYQEYTALSGIEDAQISHFEVKNEDFDNITTNTPFVNTWTYSSEEMFSKVNEDIIV